MIQEVKIAGSRVGVLIGKGGATKKELEVKTHTTITVDSKEGLVTVESSEEHTISLLRAVEIINAINRGFSPERAFEMIEDEDLLLDVIDLSGMAEGPRMKTCSSMLSIFRVWQKVHGSLIGSGEG